MKAASGCRSVGNAAATTILMIAVLLGCLTISAQCGRVPTDLAGERGEIAAVAGNVPSDDDLAAMAPPPVCYKACGNGRCDYCCLSVYMPTHCWPTEGECKQKCHPPVRRAVWSPRSDGNSGIENGRP